MMPSDSHGNRNMLQIEHTELFFHWSNKKFCILCSHIVLNLAERTFLRVISLSVFSSKSTHYRLYAMV